MLEQTNTTIDEPQEVITELVVTKAVEESPCSLFKDVGVSSKPEHMSIHIIEMLFMMTQNFWFKKWFVKFRFNIVGVIIYTLSLKCKVTVSHNMKLQTQGRVSFFKSGDW